MSNLVFRRNGFSCVWAMVKANLDSWIRSHRTVFMVLFILATCYLLMNHYGLVIAEGGYALHYDEALFYQLYQGCRMPITSIFFLIMVSEIPRQICFQNYALIRGSRNRWLLAQILYCVGMVFFMFLLVLISTSLFLIPYASAGSGWSETALIENYTITEDYALIPAYIRDHFTPWAASLVAVLPMLMFWGTMTLVILFFALWGSPTTGLILYVFLIMANVTILYEAIPGLKLPIHYSTLAGILWQFQGEEKAGYQKVMAVHGIVDLLLITGMVWRVRHVDLVFYADHRL